MRGCEIAALLVLLIFVSQGLGLVTHPDVNIIIVSKPQKEKEKEQIQQQTTAEETEQLNWLMELLNSQSLATKAAPKGHKEHRHVDYELFTQHSSPQDGVDNIQKDIMPRGHGHQEYHVHYHSHHHHHGQGRHNTGNMAAAGGHLAGFKDFETLLKGKSKPRIPTGFSASEIYKNFYGSADIGIKDFPGGNTKVYRDFGVNHYKVIDGQPRRNSAKYHGHLKAPTEPIGRHSNLHNGQVQKSDNRDLRNKSNLNGWIVHRWF